MKTKDKYLPTKVSRSKAFFLIIIILFIYFIQNLPIIFLIGSTIFNYVIKPMLWMGLFLIVYFMPKIHPRSSLRHRDFINLWAFNFAIIYIAISIFVGIIDGFGKSPYSHTPLGIMLNFLYVFPMIIGTEYARSYIVHNFSNRKEKYLVFLFTALLMTITRLPFKKIIGLNFSVSTVQYIARFFAPEFCHSLLATYLVYLGGSLTSIIYYSIIEGFHWLSPILPNLKWITTALIGILVPVFCFIGIQNLYMIISKQLKNHEKRKENPISWMITSLISIGLIWFVVGVFPVYPSVVATGSMEPMIKPGDVILVKKINNANKINIGDVILFNKENVRISHRVIDIKEDKDKNCIYFKTKGDNNSIADSDLVASEQLKGIVVKVVPKIGWPTLFIKSRKDIVSLEEIEF